MLPTLGHMLQHAARRYPSRIAVEFEGESLTYEQFYRKTNQAAHALAALGLLPGDRVATLLANCPEFLTLYFAAAKTGVVFSPLNVRQSERELATVLGLLKPKALFIDRHWLEFASAQQRLLPTLERVIVIGGQEHPFETGLDDLLRRAPDSDVVTPIDPEAPHIILFTSGTTGVPKGALLPQRQFVYNAMSIGLEIGTPAFGCVLTNAPLYHIAGLHNHTVPALLLGGHVILHRHFDPDLVWRELQRRTISNLFMVPTMWAQVLDVIPKSAKPGLLVNGFSGAAPLSPALLETIRARITSNFHYSYGLTEAGPFVALLKPKYVVERRGSCGRAVFNMAIRTVDADGQPNEAGEVGEIEVSGAQTFIGYLDNPEATTTTFNGSWVRTGDVGRLDADGFLAILDRKKDMVVSGGENVYSTEVEQVLSTHPAVKECAIIGLPDSKWGEAVTAVVVAREGSELTLEDVRNHCSADLARYKLPKRLAVVSALPRTVSGKILKRQIRAELAEEKIASTDAFGGTLATRKSIDSR